MKYRNYYNIGGQLNIIVKKSKFALTFINRYAYKLV